MSASQVTPLLGLLLFAQNLSLISALLLHYSIKETLKCLFQQTLKYLSDKERGTEVQNHLAEVSKT